MSKPPGFRRPRPTAKKVEPATERMTETELKELAAKARYVGSSEHKDVPGLGLMPRPRRGALHMGDAEGLDNPDCMLCPRKWARRLDDATELLRQGIRLGKLARTRRQMPYLPKSGFGIWKLSTSCTRPSALPIQKVGTKPIP